MTRDKLLSFIEELEEPAQKLFREIELLVRDTADTSGHEFQEGGLD